mmetsp:Transcript_18707/g.42572  ORF Transcript_18707/g.42572 Transcript_18707/m.42572 type:complete len:95 (-) Transcript_18707:1987-2271(-)
MGKTMSKTMSTNHPAKTNQTKPSKATRNHAPLDWARHETTRYRSLLRACDNSYTNQCIVTDACCVTAKNRSFASETSFLPNYRERTKYRTQRQS